MKEKKKRRNRSFQLPFNSEKRQAEGRTIARIKLANDLPFYFNKTMLAAC